MSNITFLTIYREINNLSQNLFSRGFDLNRKRCNGENEQK